MCPTNLSTSTWQSDKEDPNLSLSLFFLLTSTCDPLAAYLTIPFNQKINAYFIYAQRAEGTKSRDLPLPGENKSCMKPSPIGWYFLRINGLLLLDLHISPNTIKM